MLTYLNMLATDSLTYRLGAIFSLAMTGSALEGLYLAIARKPPLAALLTMSDR